MSKHEELRRELQQIRDRLLELNKTYFELMDSGDVTGDALSPCPANIADDLHTMTRRIRHDPSLIEEYLAAQGK